MLFNIVTENHGRAISNLTPLFDYVRQTLSRCGHQVIVEYNRLHRGAVNLFLEHFPDSGAVDELLAFKAANRLTIGVVATELIVRGQIPYSQHINYTDPSEKDTMLRSRIANFERMAPALDFIWCFLGRTADEYRGRCPIVEVFPVGHAYATPEETRRSPRDIDVLFFGTATPHRLGVLEQLAREGIQVTKVGPSFPGGWAPGVLLNSMLDRAKIGLNLTLRAPEPGDQVDPRFPSCHRIPEMLEHEVCVVSETIPLDNYFADYIASTELPQIVSTCRNLLASGQWQSRALDATSRFRRERDVVEICKPVVDRTLAALKVV